MDLTLALKGQTPGEWVVLDTVRMQVLASAKSAGDAIDKAEKSSPEEAKDAVLMMVPDPNTVCIY